jgi:phosphopantothenate-cysteine ligase
MEKTPKAISRIMKLQPETILIGFKLLAGVNEDELIRVAHDLLIKNDCDFVLANDSEKINADTHEAFLITPDCSYQRFYSKQEIAEGIVKAVIKKKGGGNN